MQLQRLKWYSNNYCRCQYIATVPKHIVHKNKRAQTWNMWCESGESLGKWLLAQLQMGLFGKWPLTWCICMHVYVVLLC